MNYVVEDIGKVVQSMRGGGFTLYNDTAITISPYYMFGHTLEISNRLDTAQKDPVLKARRFPMIALIQDFEEVVDRGMWRSTLNIVIVAITKRELNSQQRMADAPIPDKNNATFKTILYPLYEAFINAVRDSALFSWDQALEIKYPPHTKIDRPFWGTSGPSGNLANIFNDPLDAIEIKNLRLNQRLKFNCP